MSHPSLLQAFPIVAAALGNQLGVQVRIGGREACTNGRIIQIPAYDGDAPGYREVAWGFLAHEAAHLRYTDFAALNAAPLSPLGRAIFGILEDVRVERCLAVPYPGTCLTIAATIRFLLASGAFSVPSGEAHPGAVLLNFLLFDLRARELQQTVLEPLAAIAAERLEGCFPAGAVTRLYGVLAEVPALADTEAALNLTQRILRMLQEAQDDAPSAGEQVAAWPTTSIGADPADSKAAASGDRSDAAAGVEAGREVLTRALTADESDLGTDLFEQVRDWLGRQADRKAPVLLPAGEDPPVDVRRGRKLFSKVLAESARLRAGLQGFVQASRLRRPIHRQAGRRIDPHRLARLATADAKVFLRQTRRIEPDTAVHLLVDRSSSMSDPVIHRDQYLGERMVLAWNAALALVLALEGIDGVNPAVTAFPGRDRDLTSVYRILPHGGRVRAFCGAFGMSAAGSTPLAEAMWYAAAQLLSCRESRKLLLVLTDGAPDDVEAVLTMVARCRASAIEVVGVGLNIAVNHLFSRSIEIGDLGELRTRLFDLSRELLIPD